MGNTASGNKGCFIKPKKAWRLLKTADEGNVTAYIFGVSGSGKTTLVSRYLGTRKYMVVDAGGIRPDDLVVESSNARKIIVIDNLHELSWGDVDTVREQIDPDETICWRGYLRCTVDSICIECIQCHGSFLCKCRHDS